MQIVLGQSWDKKTLKACTFDVTRYMNENHKLHILK